MADMIRKKLIGNCKRVVVKAGTRLLTDPQSMPALVKQIAAIRQSGRQVILVSSGAVGMGMKLLGMTKRPHHLSEIQALAAMGQVKLMSMYEEECLKYGFRAAQLLLTADDLRSRERHLNAMNCIEALLSKDILPVINENDPVSVDELKFGDNDTLASYLGSMVRADLTIILTTVNGLLQPNPDGTLGDRIPLVQGVTREQREMATGTDDGNTSIGGMITKIRAAEILNESGDTLWIASGLMPDILQKIFAAEDVGTVFLPAEGIHKLEAKKRWIAVFSKVSGVLTVDEGAKRAIERRAGSLLPSGVTKVEGTFKRGDVLEIRDSAGDVIARGQTNFSSAECRKLAGCHSNEIRGILGCDAEEEIIHRNSLAVVH
ncbi:MAG: glutamate 5-kinase [Lentisphaeria bacterium]|nr:glutamate 5-kinase [Lentisphaeria bacterium]